MRHTLKRMPSSMKGTDTVCFIVPVFYVVKLEYTVIGRKGKANIAIRQETEKKSAPHTVHERWRHGAARQFIEKN